jgi:hypothetical protein
VIHMTGAHARAIDALYTGILHILHSPHNPSLCNATPGGNAACDQSLPPRDGAWPAETAQLRVPERPPSSGANLAAKKARPPSQSPLPAALLMAVGQSKAELLAYQKQCGPIRL